MTEDEMTRQEAFDRAARGLAGQGFEKSLSVSGDKCLYRGAGGLKCAIGHLIPDELYDPKMDASVADRVPFGTIIEICGLHASDVEFAADLQSAHDDAGDTGGLSMQRGLAEFAVRWSLDDRSIGRRP